MTRTRKSRLFRYVINGIVAVVMLFPFYWTIVTSVKSREHIISYPPVFYPRGFTVENYVRAFSVPEVTGRINYLRMMGNSLFLGVVATLGVCVSAALAGFAYSYKEFPGRKLSFYLVLSAMLIPFQALLVPLFGEMNSLGLIDNKASLILVYVTFFQPLGMFIMKNSFDSVPRELYESAWIEGCGDMRVFAHVAMPNVKMGLSTVAVFTSAYVWNEFLMALIFMTSRKNFTLPVGLAFSHQPPFEINWGMITTISVLTFVPTVVLFLFLRRTFISGVTAGALSAE